jgi:hypothetical protein
MTNLPYSFFFEDYATFIVIKREIAQSNEEILEELAKTFPHINTRILAVKNILGYWSAYDYETNTSIYCGTMSLTKTKETIKKYISENNKV